MSELINELQDFSFIRDEERARAIEEKSNQLPRSVVRPNTFLLLDGEWRFEVDYKDRGLSEQWYLGHKSHSTAVWPGSVESHMLAARDEQHHTAGWQDSVIVWYEREFTVPDGWHSTPDWITQVTFGACGYETRVWLNGHPLRTIEGEEVHFGEYTSFSYELMLRSERPSGYT